VPVTKSWNHSIRRHLKASMAREPSQYQAHNNSALISFFTLLFPGLIPFFKGTYVVTSTDEPITYIISYTEMRLTCSRRRPIVTGSLGR